MTHSIHAIARPSARSWNGCAGAAALLALICLTANAPAALSAEKKEAQQISRVIAKEMTAAQKAIQAGQWAEALKQLEAASTKPGLTPFDLMSIDRFEGFANIKLNNLKAGQADYEKALATGAVSAEDKVSMTRTLFSIWRAPGSFKRPSTTARKWRPAAWRHERFDHHCAELLPAEGLQEHRCLGGQVRRGCPQGGGAPKETLFLFKLQCASDTGDNQAMVPLAVDLIAWATSPETGIPCCVSNGRTSVTTTTP